MYARRAVAVVGAVVLGLACGGGGGGGGGPITVSGRVWPPLDQLTLYIGSQSTTPDATTGAFTLSGVKPPYDLVVRHDDQVLVIQGLRRMDPEVYAGLMPGVMLGYPVTFVSGGLGPPVLLDLTDHVAKTAWGSPEAAGESTAFAVAGVQFKQGVAWVAPPASTTGNLHALQWHRKNATDPSPDAYVAYGKTTGITVIQGTDVSSVAIATAGGISNLHLQGTTSAPTGFTLQGFVVALRFPDNAQMNIVEQYPPAAGAFDVITPSLDGVTGYLRAEAMSASNEFSMATRSNVALSATGVSIALRAAPSLTLPADAATDVTRSTAFSWQAFPGGVHMADFAPMGNTGPWVRVITPHATLVLPDLSSFGLTLPTSTQYGWSVRGYSPFSSTDAFLEPGLGRRDWHVGSESYHGESALRTFTTAATL